MKKWRTRIVPSTRVAFDYRKQNITAALQEDDISEAFVEPATEQSAIQNEASTSSAPDAKIMKLERSNSKLF